MRPHLTRNRIIFLSRSSDALPCPASITPGVEYRQVDNGYRVPVAEDDRIRTGLATQLIALSVGVPVDAITARERLGLKACRARWLAMYLAHVGFGWPLERVGHAFGLNRATAGVACRWAEDARDDAAIDALLDRLEVILRDLGEAPRLELAA